MKAVVIMYISTDLRAPRHKRAPTKTNQTTRPPTFKMQRTLQNGEVFKSQITKKTAVRLSLLEMTQKVHP